AEPANASEPATRAPAAVNSSLLMMNLPCAFAESLSDSRERRLNAMAGRKATATRNCCPNGNRAHCAAVPAQAPSAPRDDAPADGETASAGGGRWRIACDGDRAVRWRYRGDLEDQLATDGLGDAPAVVGNLDEGAGAADHVAAIMVVERHPGRAAHAAAG